MQGVYFGGDSQGAGEQGSGRGRGKAGKPAQGCVVGLLLPRASGAQAHGGLSEKPWRMHLPVMPVGHFPLTPNSPQLGAASTDTDCRTFVDCVCCVEQHF